MSQGRAKRRGSRRAPAGKGIGHVMKNARAFDDLKVRQHLCNAGELMNVGQPALGIVAFEPHGALEVLPGTA